MSEERKRMSILGRLWWLVDASRRTLLNLIFLALIGLVIWALLKPGTPDLKPKTALVLNLAGPLTEQKTGSARDSALKQVQGEEVAQSRLRDVLAVLDAAAKDPNVPHVLLALDDFGGAGLPTLREVAAAIERFKASGKPVYAWGAGYDQRSYFLAAHATEVWVHPLGGVLIEGFGRPRNYYKDAFDKFGVQATVLRVGKFKSFGEVYSASGPSPETIEAEKFLYDALWTSWLASVEKARKLPAGTVMKLIDGLPDNLTAAGGNLAQLALQEKLVDKLKTRDEMRAFLIEKGAKDEAAASAPQPQTTFLQVNFNDYLARLKPSTTGDAVGVIVAEGEIGDGQAPGGSIGGESTSALIRQAREDKAIKAIVLRVDSPGGSVYGSELIRRELELTRAAGKPVVVSMGDLAASGGYWISLASDEVMADETTITGSIGVLAVLPSVKGAMDKIGVNTAGYGTTWLAGSLDPRKTLDPRLAAIVQTSINRVYTDFTQTAAKARKTTPEKIDEVAQGRVWTGAQALERGLVDKLGSLGDAITLAAARAKLPADARVVYVEKPPGKLQQVLEMFNVTEASLTGRVLAALAPGLAAADPVHMLLPGAPQAVVDGVRRDLGWLAAVSEKDKPFDAVVHCLCTTP
jgi:protease-4